MKDKQDNIVAISRARGTFALLAVLMVTVGQMMLYTTPTRQDTGIPGSMWLSLAGVALFALSLTVPVPGFLQRFFGRLALSVQSGWILAAAAFSILTAVSMAWFARIPNLSYLPVLSLWFLAAFCYVAAFAHFDLQGPGWRQWLRDHRWELIIVGVVTLLAAMLRFYRLGAIPRVLNGDEGWLGLTAQATISDPLSNPFALWNNISAFYLQEVNFIFTIFGPTAFALRLLPAVAGMLSVPAVYLLARQVAGRRAALIASALLAFSHFDLNFSRTAGSDYIFTTLLIPLILYLLLSAIEKHSLVRSALSGVLLAIFFCTNLIGQALVGLLAAISLAMLLFRYWRRTAVRELLAFWGALVIMVIPEVVYSWQHPEDFLARMSSSGTFQTGWLAQTAAATGQAPVIILAERVTHAFLSLVYYPALDFYGSPVPPLTLFSAAFFLIGLGVCLIRTRNLNYLLVNAYFWGFTFSVGIFAIPPSADTYRMLTVLPAAILMAAVGFEAILGALGLAWEKSRVRYALFAGLVLVSLLATNLWTYYGEFAGRCLYADNTVGRFASYMGSYAGTVRPEDSIYLLSNDIFRYGTHASTDFLSGSHPIINVPDSVDTLTIKPGESILAVPDRFNELENWAAAHPGGQLHDFYDCKKIILVVYQIPESSSEPAAAQ